MAYCRRRNYLTLLEPLDCHRNRPIGPDLCKCRILGRVGTGATICLTVDGVMT
jgi:hypothetical protein